MKRCASLIFVFFVSFFSASGNPLPLELPRESLGLEEVVYGEAIRIKFSALYDIRPIKNGITGNVNLYIPIPTATQYQKVVISSVSGFEIEDILRDRWGNTVIKTEKKDAAGFPDSITVTLFVETVPVSFTQPRGYYYDLEVNKALGGDSEISFAVIQQCVSEYKIEETGTGDPLTRIYSDKIDAFYPFTMTDYLNKAKEFAVRYEDKGVSCRYLYGWYFPHKVDRFFRNFNVEIAASEGFLLYDEKLDLYKSPGGEVGLIFSPSTGDESPFYMGVERDGRVLFPEIRFYVTGGEVGLDGSIDERYDNNYDPVDTYGYQSISSGEFIIPGSSIKNIEGFLLSRKKGDNRKYYENAEAVYIEDLVMCEKIENYQPVGITSTFSGIGKAAAFITFKDRVSEKKMTCTWIMPSGRVYYDFTTDVNKSWGIYYLFLTIIQGMEKGIWTLKVEINGNLEGRINFAIQ